MAGRALTKRRQRAAVEVSGRVGLAARGVIFAVVGVLALLLATGHRSPEADRQGALQAVTAQPFGRVLVALLAIGFAAFAAWRIAEAAAGEKWSERVADAGRAVLYAALFVSAASFALRGSRRSGGGSRREVDLTAHVLQWPGGRVIVVAAGLVIIGAGIWNGYRGLAQRYRKKLKWSEMGDVAERLVPVLGTAGLVGRMLAFVLAGAFVVHAGWAHDPSEAGGLDVSLRHLLEARGGPLLVALVAVGLLLFGLYEFAEARYRDVSS